jgi:hypothetical protein
MRREYNAAVRKYKLSARLNNVPGVDVEVE